jgi:ABC-2 type transport system ATP-binding protein
MLEINNLGVKFGNKVILNGCSFSCEPGKIYGLVGLNGSGKSTLINSLYNFAQKSEGEFKYNNSILSRNDIAYLETNNYYYSHITGHEYLKFFPKNNQQLVEEYLGYFQLPLDKIIDNYSTGMKKKLAIIGFLHLEKPILILDEPFNGLDLEANHYLEKLLLTLKASNKIIIVTSHILATLFPICDKIMWLKNGKIEQNFNKEDFSRIENTIFD